VIVKKIADLVYGFCVLKKREKLKLLKKNDSL